MKFVDLDTEYKKIEPLVKANIEKVLQHGQYIMGPEIEILEQKLASLFGSKYCITLANGTDALHLGLLAYNIQPGDEIITTPFTFFATVEAILLVGAKPVFVDIDPDTFNLNANLIAAAITPKTKAILPVSLYGQCADMDEINAIAKQHDLIVIEDAAQSLGATYKNKFSGNLADLTCTSFFPSKPLGCYGDGGACFTNDFEIAETLRLSRNHGQDTRYHHAKLGVNSRLDTLQAAILLAKLEIFSELISKRQQVAAMYNQLLRKTVRTPVVRSYNTSAYAQYTIKTSQRSRIQNYLNQHKIPTAIHYPMPCNQQPILQKYGNYAAQSFPEAELAARQVLSLPMHPFLTTEVLEEISSRLTESLAIAVPA